MSCVAVATSPSFTPGHSPSVAAIVRHRDDPGSFRDVRPSPSQLVVSCLDLLAAPPSSPLLYAAATTTPGRHCPSPFRTSSSTSSCTSGSNINCKSSPGHSSSSSLSMPPPSPKVQCSPRTTPSWTPSNSPVPAPAGPPTTTATTRSTVCFCGGGGGLAISSSPCSCNLAASLSPGEPPATATAWREKQQRHSHNNSEALAAAAAAGVSVVLESPSHSSGLPLPSIGGASKRYSSAMPPPPPSPRFGGPRPSFAHPRPAVSRPDSFAANTPNVRKHLTISLDECAQRPGDNHDAAEAGAAAAAVPAFSTSSKLRNDDKGDVGRLSGNAHINVPQQQQHQHQHHRAGGGGDGGAVLTTVTPPLKRKRPPKLEIPLGVNQLPLKGSQGSSLLAFKTADVGEDALDDMTVEGSYYAIACKKGRRETLEDTQRAVPNLHGDPQQAFFGVFDGHGGRKAADFAAEHLVERITEAMDGVKEGEEAMTPEAATRAGYLATDAEFLNKGIGSGACCVTATMKDGFMVVANAGDCRAVLSRAGTAEVLTRDHRAEREDERQRIEDAGGFVDDSTGTWRVQGVLAVTRGIGDLDLKEWVSAEPEVQRLPITPECEFLILASDGLWDAVSNQEALDTARSLLRSERVNPEAEAMDLQIPLAMASSSLSKGADDEQRSTLGLNIGQQQPLSSSSRSFGSVKDRDEEVDLCVGTLDTDMPNVGFPEPGFPSTGPVAACRKLVEISVSRGCRDDISVLIVNLAHFINQEGGFSAPSG